MTTEVPRGADRRFGRFGRASIGRRLVILVLLVALPISAALAYAVVSARTDAGEAAERASQQLSALAVSSVETFISDVEAEMKVIAKRPLIRAADGSRCDPILAQLVALHSYLANAGVADLRGQIICSALAAPRAGLPSAADTAWFQEVESTGRFTLGEPVLGRISGRRVSVFALPVEAREGRSGYLFLPIDLVRFQRYVQGLAGADELVAVLTEKGQIIARSAESERYVGENIGPERLKQLHSGAAVATGIDGIRRIYSSVRVPDTPWFVSAGMPVSVAYGDSDRLGTSLVVITVALLTASLVAAAVVSHGIARPVQALADRARGITAGQPFRELPLTGPSEVSVAAGWFNEMVRSERAAREESRRLWGELSETRQRAARRRIALLERIAAAEDAERERIARDIHDNTIQMLAAASLGVEGLNRGIAANRLPPDTLTDRLTAVSGVLTSAMTSVRQVIFDLAPPDVTQPLVTSVSALAGGLFAGTDTKVEVTGALPDLSARRTQLVYRIVAEALRNARQHADASNVEVTFEAQGEELVVSVRDDGKGVPATGPESTWGHLGLRTMTERAQLLGGSCTLERRPEGGTCVMLRFSHEGLDAREARGVPDRAGSGRISEAPSATADPSPRG